MMNYRKLTIPFFFLLLILITAFTTATHLFANKEKWLPEAFNPAKTTLLIQENPGGEKENDKMIEFIDKEYKWRYEVVSAGLIKNNKKYKNRKQYQYALMWADTASNSLDPGSHSLFHDLDGYFIDLNTGTQYPKSGYGYSYGKNGYKKVIYAIDKAFKELEE